MSFLRFATVVTALLVSTIASASPTTPRLPRPGRVTPASEPLLVPPLAGATRVVRSDDGLTVVWAEGAMGTLASRTAGAVFDVLEPLGPALGLARPRSELAVDALEGDALGMLHCRLHRVADGLPVVDSELVLHFDARGTLVAMNGRYAGSLAGMLPDARPLAGDVLVSRAVAAVLPQARGAGFTGVNLSEVPVVRRVVWPEPTARAAEILVAFAPHLRWRVFVDEASGAILARRSEVRHDNPATGSGVDSFGRTRSLNVTYFSNQGIYGTVDSSLPRARLVTVNAQNRSDFSGSIFGSRTTTFSDSAAVDVHANLRLVHDYYRTTHQRDSWDGQGADLQALVHYGYAYANAFWNGSLMAFGDGDGQRLGKLSRCLDVTAHELTHAVIQTTVPLVYENQPGALNEHFADVFAALVDDANWTVGESCVGPRLGRAFMRDMADPNAGDQPDHMRDYQRLPNTEEGDNGGVHVNSGIPNKAAHLVAQSLGRPALGSIWYRVLAQRYLNTRAQFIDLRRAALRACGELSVGSCASVGSAFDQVGITDVSGGSGGCPANSHLEGSSCACNTGYRPNATRTACEPIPSASCPPNSTQIGTDCYCNDGYVVNAAGTGCEPERTAQCPEHSHAEEGTCVCDDGYQGSPTSDAGCVPVEVTCPPNSQPSTTQPGACVCLPGWVPDSTRTSCVPGSSGCGDETFYGRCDGRTLIYCDGQRIRVIDCATEGQVCGLVNTQIGNDCIDAPVNECGSLTASGECRGDVARWCEAGRVRELDCGARDYDCVFRESQGDFYCATCPRHSTLRDGPEGRACYCDAGFEESEDRRRCVPVEQIPDAGTLDAGTPVDAGEQDAGTGDDGGPADAGHPDAGHADAGPADGGSDPAELDAGDEDPLEDGSGGDDRRRRGCGCAGAGDTGWIVGALAIVFARRRTWRARA